MIFLKRHKKDIIIILLLSFILTFIMQFAIYYFGMTTDCFTSNNHMYAQCQAAKTSSQLANILIAPVHFLGPKCTGELCGLGNAIFFVGWMVYMLNFIGFCIVTTVALTIRKYMQKRSQEKNDNKKRLRKQKTSVT